MKTYTHFFFIHTIGDFGFGFWIVLDLLMKIINNKHTLLYNLPTIQSIQRYNALCELTKYIEILHENYQQIALIVVWKISNTLKTTIQRLV